MVALTPDDAQRAGIALPTERAMAQGAGGAIEIIPVTIDRIAAGPLEARDIPGAVARELPDLPARPELPEPRRHRPDQRRPDGPALGRGDAAAPAR